MMKNKARTGFLFLLFFLALASLIHAFPKAVRSLKTPPLRSLTGVVTGITVETLTLRDSGGEVHEFTITGAVRSGRPGTFGGDIFSVWYDEPLSETGDHLQARQYKKLADGPRVPDNSLPETIPSDWRDGGIFQDSYAAAYETLKTLTPEQKIGQIFLARFPENQYAVGTVNRYQPGGFLLFAEDFKRKSKEDVAAMLEQVQKASALPLLVATDEEGGPVVRVSGHARLRDKPFPSPQELYKSGGLDAVRRDAEGKSQFLKELGINLNLAPVADVSADPKDYIYGRTVGLPAEETGAYVKTVVEAAQSSGISSTLKHFPGYGNNRDTHTGSARDKRPYERFEREDFLPFREGIAAGVHSILVSHNIVECMDSKNPASLSPAVHAILREDLGFTGVVMTDDLYMDAVAEQESTLSPAVEAVLAGNDLLIITDLAGGSRQVLEAVENGVIEKEQLNRAVFRILAWKYHVGLLPS